MGHSDYEILNRFFREQHRKFKRRAYSLLQCLGSRHSLHSEHGEWLKRQGQKPGTASPAPPEGENHRPKED